MKTSEISLDDKHHHKVWATNSWTNFEHEFPPLLCMLSSDHQTSINKSPTSTLHTLGEHQFDYHINELVK